MEEDEVDVLQKAIDDGVNMDVILPVVQRINDQQNIIGNLKSKVCELEVEAAMHISEINMVKKEVSEHESANKKLQDEIAQKVSGYEAKIARLNEDRAEILEELLRLERMEMKFLVLEKTVAELNCDKSQLEEKLQEKQIELETKEQIVTKLNEEKMDFIQQLQTNQSNSEAIEETVKKLNEEKMDFIQQLQINQSNFEAIKMTVNKLNSEKEEVVQQADQYKFDYEVLTDIMANLVKEKSEVVAANEHQKKQIHILQEQSDNLKQQQKALQSKYNKMQVIIRCAVDYESNVNDLELVDMPNMMSDISNITKNVPLKPIEMIENDANTTAKKVVEHPDVENGPQKIYKCSSCSKEYGKKASYTRHLLTHKAQFQCDVCNKIFNQKNGLLRHSRVHSGEKPFMCTICAQKFSQRAHLKKHMGTHKNN